LAFSLKFKISSDKFNTWDPQKIPPNLRKIGPVLGFVLGLGPRWHFKINLSILLNFGEIILGVTGIKFFTKAFESKTCKTSRILMDPKIYFDSKKTTTKKLIPNLVFLKKTQLHRRPLWELYKLTTVEILIRIPPKNK
jgi:hypothetical protein